MKTILITISILLAAVYSIAQPVHSFSLKTGVSLANQNWEYKTAFIENKCDYKTGYYVALSAELFRTKFMSFVADAAYIRKGMQQEIELTTPEQPEGTGEFTLYKNSFNYLSLSPMAKFFYSFDKLSAYVTAGPRLDFELGQKAAIEGYYISESKKLILGVTAGAGTEYRINNLGFLLEFQAQPDLTPVFNNNPSETETGLKVTNQAYMISTGLIYYLD